MGLFDRFRTREKALKSIDSPRATDVVGVGGAKEDDLVTMTFNDRNITFSGSLAGYDYDAL